MTAIELKKMIFRIEGKFIAQALQGRQKVGFYGWLCRPCRACTNGVAFPGLTPWAIVFRSVGAWFGKSFS